MRESLHGIRGLRSQFEEHDASAISCLDTGSRFVIFLIAIGRSWMSELVVERNKRIFRSFAVDYSLGTGGSTHSMQSRISDTPIVTYPQQRIRHYCFLMIRQNLVCANTTPLRWLSLHIPLWASSIEMALVDSILRIACAYCD